jgi:hypothetical protein
LEIRIPRGKGVVFGKNIEQENKKMGGNSKKKEQIIDKWKFEDTGVNKSHKLSKKMQ